MARTGFSTSNYLETSAVASGPPMTMAAWVSSSVIGAVQAALSISNNSGNASDFYIGVSNTNKALAGNVSNTSTSGTATGATTVPIDGFYHIAGRYISSASREVYLNGAIDGSSSTSIAVSGINATTIGVRHIGGVLNSSFGGSVAETAIWNIALSAADILALSKGLSPLLMHPEALVAYWPLIGNNSPENNLKSNSATMSIVGSLSKAAHPRIFMPRRRLVA